MCFSNSIKFRQHKIGNKTGEQNYFFNVIFLFFLNRKRSLVHKQTFFEKFLLHAKFNFCVYNVFLDTLIVFRQHKIGNKTGEQNYHLFQVKTIKLNYLTLGSESFSFDVRITTIGYVALRRLTKCGCYILGVVLFSTVTFRHLIKD